jgi:hypothetical protein
VNGTLPTSLIDYREALEDAVRRDLVRSRVGWRRGLVLRSALGAAVVAAAALGALGIVSRDGAHASVVDRAAAAVAPSPGTILHVDIHGSQTNPDGSTITWRDESWQQESPPYDRRQIETAPDGSITESGNTDGREELYDAARNTIYVSAPEPSATPSELNSYEIEPGPRPGTAVLRMPGLEARKKGARVFATVVITMRQAKALKKGTDVIAWGVGPNSRTASVTVVPASSLPKPPPSSDDSSTADPTSGDFRSQILALLRSGEARVLGHRTIDGQDTIEIGSADGHMTYHVDPGTYQPVELDTKGTGGGTALRFRTYEMLDPGANGDLLSLTTQHPDARVDRDPAHYRAAEARLFPEG